MSNWDRNIPKRKYRERAQPKAREHLGLLEKKKDYKKRAIDYQSKRKHLNKLKLISSLKNEDEFYYRMIRSKIQVSSNI